MATCTWLGREVGVGINVRTKANALDGWARNSSNLLSSPTITESVTINSELVVALPVYLSNAPFKT